MGGDNPASNKAHARSVPLVPAGRRFAGWPRVRTTPGRQSAAVPGSSVGPPATRTSPIVTAPELGAVRHGEPEPGHRAAVRAGNGRAQRPRSAGGDRAQGEGPLPPPGLDHLELEGGSSATGPRRPPVTKATTAVADPATTTASVAPRPQPRARPEPRPGPVGQQRGQLVRGRRRRVRGVGAVLVPRGRPDLDRGGADARRVHRQPGQRLMHRPVVQQGPAPRRP